MSVVVRAALAGDMRAVETVRIATWKVAYRGLLPDDLLDGLEVTEERVASLVARCATGEVESVVAVVDDEIVGFASCGQCRDEDLPGARELWAIYVLPEHWDTGAGAALVSAAGALDVVWVLEGNARAIGFYERRGFRADGTTKLVDWLPPPHATELRYVLR